MRTLFTKNRTKKQAAGRCKPPYCSLLLYCLLLCCQLSTAQSFPVQVIAQATPPAPANFSDFANPSALNGPFRVQLVLNDFQISDRQVRLQVTLNGSGIGFQSNENVIGAMPLFLEGGIPTVLDHTLLAPYFEFGNLTGIPPNVYSSPIPDGVYQVCFQVFDVLTGKRLSNNACTTINVFKNSPPILVLPENGSDIVERSPQNIMFQWTPRHINFSQVEYEFSLVEIWDNAMDPQAAFLGSTPLFTAITSATTYVYGPGDPILLPNRTYAWRVQAKAKQGAEEVGTFLNQGYSQIFSFNHIAGCYVPNGIRHEVRGANQTNIFWEDNSTSVPQFRVRYRAQGNGNAWFYNQTTANWTTLWDLQASTTYEYQLQKTCAVAESDWSPLRQFTTNLETEEEDLYQCGVSPDVGITNQDPLPQLSVGESFTAGDFQVVATEVHGGNGYFSGKGYTRLPYLSNIKLAVHFTNILVNTDRQLAQGTVITEFDPTMGNIVDTGDVVETVGALGEAVGDLLEELFSQKEELLAQLSEAESFEEQQSIISQINDLEVTIDQQIDQIPNKENLPQELQDELQELKQEGSIVANNVLTPQEIADISTADAERRERIKEITAIAESGELDMVSDKIWFMPDWTPFKLAESVSNTILQSGSQTVVGTVHGLKYNGTDHYARFSSDGNFEGYYIENTDDRADIPPLENLNEEAEVYLYQYLPNECNAIFKTSFGYVDGLRSNIPYTQENENLTRAYISNCEDDVHGQIEQPNSIIVNIDGQSEIISAAKQNQETPDEAFALNVRILDFAGITSASEKQELAQQMGNTRILEGNLMHYILTDGDTQPSLINNFLELVPDPGTYYRWIHFEDSGRVIINDKVPAGFDEALRRAAYHWTQDYWDNLELNTNKGTRDFLFSYMLQTNMMLSTLADLLAEVQIGEKYWNAGDEANYVAQMEYVARLFAVLTGQALSVFNAEQAQLQFAFYCGIFNGLMDELAGVVQLGDMLTEYVTNVDSARTFDEGLNHIDLVTLWSQFQGAHGLDGNGSLNQYVLAHQLGKDLIFVASLFVGVGEIASVNKAGQVLRNLENVADLAKMTKARRLKTLFPEEWDKLEALTPLPDNFWTKLDELGEAQGRFLADFDAQQLQRFVENPNLVDAWEKLYGLGEAFPDALRRNAGFLEDFDGLLKNQDYKRIFDPLADGSHVSLLKNNVNAAEEAALKLFVEDNFYENFNKALAGEISMTHEYRAMKELMVSAHTKLPKEAGVTVFRGAGDIESNFAQGLSKGEEFDFGGRFTSSSFSESEADLFRMGGKGDVIWEIESKTGVDITKINSGEEEVLFKPFTKYRVEDIVPSPSNPDVFIFKIKEI